MNNKLFVVKNGLQTQQINFVSPNTINTLSVTMMDSDTLSVIGNTGQLFSIVDSQSGTIFSVNDVSGMPSIEVDDTGVIRLAPNIGNVLVGTTIDNGVDKLQINGSVLANSFTGALSGNATSADKLSTAREINGVPFDGTASITIYDSTKLPLTGGSVSGPIVSTSTITAAAITATSESRFSTSTFVDPHTGTSYAIKASGGVSTDVVDISGKVNMVWNSVENSLDFVLV